MTHFSIVMATYNGARHLQRQLDSLAAQTLRPTELVVGDDGSTDETLDILERFSIAAPFPVIVVRNPVNLGYGQNFLVSAQRATGDWIAFCDQDDIWDRDKLAHCERWIANGPTDLILIVHDATVLDELKSVAPKKLYNYRTPQLFGPLARDPTWFCAGFTQVFRADLVRSLSIEPRVGGLFFSGEDPSLDRKAHDTWIPLLANVTGSTLVRPEPLVCYRRHGETVTTLAERPGIIARISNRLRGNGQLFVNISNWYAEAAGVLHSQVAATVDPNFRVAIHTAITEFRDYRCGLLARAALYEPRPRIARLGAWLALVRDRHYGRGRWPFGLRAMAKDLFHILI